MMGWDSLSQRQASETVTLAAKKKQKNGVCDQVNGSMLYALCTSTGHIFVAFVHSRDNEKVLAEATICIRFVFFVSILQEEPERGSLPIAIVYIVASVRQ